MEFISIRFLVLFLPICLLLHSLLRPMKAKNLVLLLASLVFYACYDIKYVLFLLLSIALTYGGGIWGSHVQHRKKLEKGIYLSALILNFLILLIFKYSQFTVGNINSIIGRWGMEITFPKLLLPVGLSFIIFQSSTYLLDLYHGKTEVEKNLLDYSLFVSFFPTITSGPIQRSKKFLPQVHQRNLPNFKEVQSAVVMFMWGACLKMILADRLALFTNAVYAAHTNYEGWILIICALAYSIQIYADFSAYSYMAIAISRLFGFKLDDNFRQPYLSLTISDFWRRWHISLTSWFTDYIYIPLGGNRRGVLRTYVNIAIVFLVSGLWHGAGWSFIVWGGIHAVYQIVGRLTKPSREKLYNRMGINRNTVGYRLWQRIFIFLIVSFAWIFFRAESFHQAISFIHQMVSVWNPWVLFDKSLFQIGLSPVEWNIIFVALATLLAVSLCCEQQRDDFKLTAQNFLCRVFLFELMFVALIVFGMYGEGYSASSFIYAGF